jgi:hypothetical protein
MSRKAVGIVEGFFSSPLKPWNDRERRRTLDFVLQHAGGINTYFYCPKDDPYITKRWADRYPLAKAKQLSAFARRCQSSGISPIFGLNPTLDQVNLSDARSRQLWVSQVQSKLDQALRMGFKGLSLLFDDIPLAYDVADNARLTLSQSEKLMVSLVNEVYQLYKGKVACFWFCGPDYCFRKASPLTKQLRHLNPGIGVVWTGNEIFVKNISRSDISRVKRLLGPRREIVYWINYPVNDCEQSLGCFNLGGAPAPTADVFSALGAYLVNPMRECYANLPLYLTVSELARRPRSYDRQKAWDKALVQLFGQHARAVSFLLQNFGTRNMVDDSWPELIGQLSSPASLRSVKAKVNQALRELESAPLGRDARTFLQAIRDVFHSARTFVSIIDRIEKSKTIDRTFLTRNDWFPTKLNQPRYAPEIMRILQYRLSQLHKFGARGTLPASALKTVRKFASAYSGQEKLNLTPQDSAKLQRAIDAAVKKEQEALRALLNDPKRNPKDRARAYLYRNSCTRFNSP